MADLIDGQAIAEQNVRTIDSATAPSVAIRPS